MHRDGIVRVSVLLRSAAVVVGNGHDHHGQVSSSADLLVIMVDIGKEVCARSVLNCLTHCDSSGLTLAQCCLNSGLTDSVRGHFH